MERKRRTDQRTNQRCSIKVAERSHLGWRIIACPGFSDHPCIAGPTFHYPCDGVNRVIWENPDGATGRSLQHDGYSSTRFASLVVEESPFLLDPADADKFPIRTRRQAETPRVTILHNKEFAEVLVDYCDCWRTQVQPVPLG